MKRTPFVTLCQEMPLSQSCLSPHFDRKKISVVAKVWSSKMMILNKEWKWVTLHSKSHSFQFLTLSHTSGHKYYLLLSEELERWESWGSGILNLLKLIQVINGWAGVWINLGLITKFVIFLPEQIVFDSTLKKDLLNWQKFFKVC